MKTLFTEQDFHDTEDKDDCNSEATLTCSYKVAEKSNLDQSGLKNRSECHSNSESDNLIICSKEQADNFQTSKAEKHKLSPGIYLQKVLFNSVTQKFRSQSLPNCLEKKKYHKSVASDKIEDVQEISVPLVNAEVREISSDLWFKTWPERAVDKIIVRNGSELVEENINANTEEDLTHFQGSEIRPTNNSSQLNSREIILKEPSSWKKHPVRSPQSVGTDDDRESKLPNVGAKASSIPLDELLDNFPLAYSPVTKQLLLISTNKERSSNTCDLNSRGKFESVESSSRYTGEAISNLEEAASGKPYGGKGWSFNPKGLECDGSGLHSASTEVSSFSSTVSSLSDNSPSTNEDSALGSLLDHGDTCSLVSLGSCSAFSEDSIGDKSRKKSLTGFFSRNVFNWKGSSRSEECNSHGGGWRIFSKNSSPGSSHTSLSTDHYAESDNGSVAPDSPSSVRSGSSSTNKTTGPGLEKRVASSSALIQLARPAHLPAKTPEEDARHRQEYQQMVEAARKRELKEAKQKKKQIQAQLRVEEQLAQASRVWTHEILPRWDQMHNSKKARELWWQGVPPCVRGKVWQLAIGNPLHLTRSLYDIYVQRAQDRLRNEKGDCCGSCGADGDCVADSRERSMQQIQLDISRTFPHLCIFQKGGPYYDTLHCLLAAYVCYRPDVGYVQGMSFIAAVLILNMEASDAFVCFANLLNSPCHMAFFHLNQPLMQAYYSTYNELFKYNLPQLFAHFSTTALSPDLYLLDWIYTVFSKAMCLDLACRVWDVFLRDGEQFLFRAALGILHLCQDTLLQMDFVHGSQFLTKLPDDLSGDQLFRSISCIKMTVGKATFDDILSVNSIDCH